LIGESPFSLHKKGSTMPFVAIKAKKEGPLVRKHPWVFASSLARIDGGPGPGDTVDVLGSKGTEFGKGAYSPASQIRIRMWTFDMGEIVDPAFFRRRMERALAARTELKLTKDTSAWRLINAESDGLPGLIIDLYGEVAVCQFLTSGSERWRETIVDQLNAVLNPVSVFERSDAPVRQKEGLSPRNGFICGKVPPELIDIREQGLKFLVDIRQGHKTGFYIDQRENRAMVMAHAADKSVLNCFSYSGGFGVAALAGGASAVTNIDMSASAIELCEKNAALNGFDAHRVENIEGDVFKELRTFRDSARRFDMIVLDPPKFADSRHQLPNACRGYKDINLLAAKLLNPGGLLFTFSCSGLMDADLFQKIVFDAALDAGRDVRIVRRMTQGADHPVSLNFPEGAYLKGLLCQVW
jgi:23S rRNA (cytosine1962-C5)-methyltransferase